MKLITTLLLVVFIVLGANAQNNYIRGYIVKIDNDSTAGFIEDTIDKELQEHINFRTEKDGPTTVYDATQLLKFGFFEGRQFKRYMKDSAATFGKLLNGGKVNLYVTKKKNSVIFYVENTTSHVGEVLQKKVMLIEKNGSTFKAVDSDFVRQLAVVTGANSGFISNKNIDFSERKIRKFVSEYNQISSPLTAYTYNQRIRHYRTILIGITLNGNFQASFFKGREETDQNRNRSLMWGIDLQYTNDRSIQGTSYTYLNAFPFGQRFTFGRGVITPYLSWAFGLGVLKYTYPDHLFNLSQLSTTSKSDFFFSPVARLGAGSLIKVKRNFVNVEASVNGEFITAFYSTKELFKFSCGFTF